MNLAGIVFVAMMTLPGGASGELLLFGGSGHDVFLGCLNCPEYSSDSVCNRYGTHGSHYSDTSIWNQYGTFGSKYHSSSPWNRYSSADSVPVLVDRSGNFYGYFTINPYRSDAFGEARQLKELFDSHTDLDKLRDAFCD